ncbi:patatin-like phospholipase family protein [Sphingosinicellaceae bacterium]|nr:patatin-like phospholipase family protein [Sphingosinicellaceae bacterium]
MFVALAGGGAKGVVHVGALKALERQHVKFQGLSGTSAGAIAATLKAAGFNADDIADPRTGRTIFDDLARIDPGMTRATDLFGRAGWIRIRILRRLTSGWGLGLLIFGTIVSVFGPVSVLVFWHGAPRSAEYIAGGVLLGFVVIAAIVCRTLLGGLADLSRFRSALAQLLQRKLFPTDPERPVLMGDFDGVARPLLKIVAANLATRRLTLFSAERSPKVEAADAVVASIAIPVLFRLPRVNGEMHADGGIVSNLPAWPFDEERELDPDAYTIAIEIGEPMESPRVELRGWIASLVRTALFGSSELNLRAVSRSNMITLETDIGLLDFDRSRRELLATVASATRAAEATVVTELFKRPAILRQACVVTRKLFDETFAAQPALLRAGRRTGRVRVAVAIPDGGHTRSLRLRYADGYEDCSDERILLPIVGTVAGTAWTENLPRFEVAPLPASLSLPDPCDTLRRAMVWKDLAWTICIPISTNDAIGAKKLFLVTVDGDEALSDAEDLEETIGELVDATETFFVDVVNELQTLGE